MKGRVLSIAGSDSSGGAGIQADLKAITALGGYGATAITAMTAQNTLGVHAIFPVDPEFVVEQIRTVIDDIGLDAIKIGMLHRVEVIEAIADYFDAYEGLPPVVLDPVMIAKGGAELLTTDAELAIKGRLLKRHTSLLTPNIPEAEKLVGYAITTTEAMRKASSDLLSLGCQSVLLKGGHGDRETVVDILMTADDIHEFEHPRIQSEHTHGTGCTLSSAIATGLAQKLSLKESVGRAIRYVEKAIETAPRLGAGHGPLNHTHNIPQF